MLTVYMSAGPWRASYGESCLSGAGYGESCLSGADRKPAHCAVSGSAAPSAATAEFHTCGRPW